MVQQKFHLKLYVHSRARVEFYCTVVLHSFSIEDGGGRTKEDYPISRGWDQVRGKRFCDGEVCACLLLHA